jgi:D-aminopeptidase
MSPPPQRPRARDLGLMFGSRPTGEHNAITDVPGVRVGHTTVWTDGADGIARTGATAIVPDGIAEMFRRPMAAGMAVLNGAGELTGSIEMREWGILETPMVLTATNAVGRGYDAVVDALFAAGEVGVVIPVVGECDDSWLDDISRRWVTTDDVRAAIDGAAGGAVAEGVVGAGTGMITMGYKAGIGTSSRIVADLGTVGVLVLANFGDTADLRISGVPVGAALAAESATAPTSDDAGSCIGVVVTDIPLDARQLQRVARRVGLGLARVGSVGHDGSGEIFCAVSTSNRRRRDTSGTVAQPTLVGEAINDVFTATVDATEEAVVNSLFVADTVTGVDGHVAPGLPVPRVLTLLGHPA